MQTTKTTEEISASGAVKNEWLDGWGYQLTSPEAEEAWKNKLLLDRNVESIANPNKPHNRMVELPSYQSPITGKWIDGRKARRNDLERSDCVEYDPAAVNNQAKRHSQEDAVFDKKVDEIVEREIYSMPTSKREKLVSELESGADIEIQRK